MSAVVQQAPATTWGGYARMASVEELDNSLTRLSRHTVLKGIPMTPPGTPQVAASPEQISAPDTFEYAQTPVETPSANRIPPNTPTTPMTAKLPIFVKCPESSPPSSSTAVNVVAIDNKIEQAMDLVKTHLTFAVREEVEILRNTIVELESRVVNLEAQNQVLRKYVSADVLAQLPLLMAAKSNVQDDAHNSGEGKENAQ